MTDPREDSGSRIQPVGEEHDIRDLIRQAGRRPEIPSGDFRIIKAAALAEWQELVESRRRRRTQLLLMVRAAAAAAGLIAVLGATWWWLRTSGKPGPSRVVAAVELIRGNVWLEEPEGLDPPDRSSLSIAGPLIAGLEIVTGSDSESAVNTVSIRLAGQQSVRLRSGTRIRLVSQSRVELLEGAVYVDSEAAPETDEAIEVSTAFGDVFDIGTQFEVCLGGEDQVLRVRVRSGSISLVRDQESQTATVGEQLLLQADGSFAKSPYSVSGEDWDWVLDAAPAVDIEGLPLADFLAWVSRETGWEIAYEDDVLAGAAATIELHGTIEGLRPDEAVIVVLPGSGLGHRVKDGTLNVERLPEGSNGM